MHDLQCTESVITDPIPLIKGIIERQQDVAINNNFITTMPPNVSSHDQTSQLRGRLGVR
jgi:hypothetical protein